MLVTAVKLPKRRLPSRRASSSFFLFAGGFSRGRARKPRRPSIRAGSSSPGTTSCLRLRRNLRSPEERPHLTIGLSCKPGGTTGTSTSSVCSPDPLTHSLCLHKGSFGHLPGLQVTPQGDEQLASQGDDPDASQTASSATEALL